MRKILYVGFALFLLFLFFNPAFSQDHKTLVKKGKDYIDNCRHKEKEALDVMKKAYAMKADDFEVLLWTGRAYYENREFSRAEPLLQQAVKLKPKHIEANAWLAYTYGRIGENLLKRAVYMIKSAQQMRKVMDLAPNYADTYFSLAIACTYLKWYEKPTGLFRQVAKIFMKTEKDIDAFTAEGLFKKSISLNPKNAWYYLQYGWYFLRREKPEDAKRMFEKAVSLAGKDIKCSMKDDKAPRAVALYYEEAKMWDEALKYAGMALQWNPKDLALSPKFSIKRIINRLKEEKSSNKLLLKDVADEL